MLSDDIPDSREIALICLVRACSILPELFPGREVEHAGPRIERLRKMDLIGREVSSSIAKIERNIMLAARERIMRFRKALLILSAVGGLFAAATILAPRVPIPDRLGPTLAERLWFDELWQQ